MISQEITVDVSEQIIKIQTKIERFQKLIQHVRDQKNFLDNIKINQISTDTKFELSLGGVLQCSFVKIDVGTLIPLLEQTIEDNMALIHELAKELGIDIK